MSAVLVAQLILALCAPALAQTTGIAVDGRIYTFMGSEGSYTVDGKTFVIGADTVTIQEEGKPDRVLPLYHAEDIDVVEDKVSAFIQGEAEQSDALMTEYVESSHAVEAQGQMDAAAFERYEKYGLTFDREHQALYYKGQRVRIFEDSVPLAEQGCAVLEHVDAKGVIDVQALHDPNLRVHHADGSFDLAGSLTGLYVLTEEAFAARDLSDLETPAMQETAAATEGSEMTAAEKEALYAPYAAFGLHYDAAADVLVYQGKKVRCFTDVRQSNGERMESGRFQGVITHICADAGEIDLQTIRDYAKPDASGDGTLIGMRVEPLQSADWLESGVSE